LLGNGSVKIRLSLLGNGSLKIPLSLLRLCISGLMSVYWIWGFHSGGNEKCRAFWDATPWTSTGVHGITSQKTVVFII
jgi:hypothetical protein